VYSGINNQLSRLLVSLFIRLRTVILTFIHLLIVTQIIHSAVTVDKSCDCFSIFQHGDIKKSHNLGVNRCYAKNPQQGMSEST